MLRLWFTHLSVSCHLCTTPLLWHTLWYCQLWLKHGSHYIFQTCIRIEFLTTVKLSVLLLWVEMCCGILSLKMEAVSFSKILVPTHKLKQQYNPQDHYIFQNIHSDFFCTWFYQWNVYSSVKWMLFMFPAACQFCSECHRQFACNWILNAVNCYPVNEWLNEWVALQPRRALTDVNTVP
jgi:hypothetical protein